MKPYNQLCSIGQLLTDMSVRRLLTAWRSAIFILSCFAGLMLSTPAMAVATLNYENVTVSTYSGVGSPGNTTDGTLATADYAAPVGVAFDSAGNLYVVDSSSASIRKITSAGDVTTLYSIPPSGPPVSAQSFAVKSDGSKIYVGDNANNCIRVLDGTAVPATPGDPTTTPVATLAGSCGGTRPGGGGAPAISLPYSQTKMNQMK